MLKSDCALILENFRKKLFKKSGKIKFTVSVGDEIER